MFTLMNVFKPDDFLKIGKTSADVISLTMGTNKKTGARIARAVLDNGVTLVKELTRSGVATQKVITIPEITSVAQRNDVILDLLKNGKTQQEVADILNVSQSTVSNVFRKIKF